MDMHQLNYEFNQMVGYESAHEQRRSFAVKHFADLLSFAMNLEDEKESIQGVRPKRSIADNYPAGGFSHEPCGTCLDLLSVLEDISQLPKDAGISIAIEMAEKCI